MTGEKWSEQVSAYDEVCVLKKRIFKKKGIAPSKQALVFCGNALGDNQLLITAGLRNDSVIKFVVITRTGPVAPTYEEVTLSDDPSDWEVKGRRVLSTAEDTSAKESAGETEVGGENGLFQRKSTRFPDYANRRRTRSQTNVKEVFKFHFEIMKMITDQAEHFFGPDMPGTSTMAITKEIGETANTEGLCSEDLSEISEVSSGMLVCDLSNEFRKIKIRKHRHPLPYHLIRQRTRSKTRGEEREVSSSDENESIIVDPSILAMCSQNPHRRTVQRLNASSRCMKCAFKVTNPFFCRCGKTLCSKHRIHTCARQRTTKLQEVSD